MRARSAGSSGYSTAARRLSRPSEVELAGLLLAEDVGAGGGEGQRVLGIDGELHAGVLGAEVAGAVAAHAAAAIGDRRAQDDEAGQVVVERAQAVVDPRADRRELALEHVPAGVELELGAVVVVGGPHRADDGDVVDAVADVRPPVADLDAALAALAVADLQRIERGLGVVQPLDELADVLLEKWRVEDVRVRRFLDRLAGVSCSSAGLGSKLSTWLVPPIMNSQMTFLALGVKWGRPSGGDQPWRSARRRGRSRRDGASRPGRGR